MRHWSYSSLSTFEQCPRRWFYQYKGGLRGEPTPAMDRGTKVHEQLEFALNAIVLPKRRLTTWLDRVVRRYRRMKQMHPEVALHLDRKWNRIRYAGHGTPNGTYVTGRIDVLAPGFFADWKTGKVYPEKHHDQMRLYATMLHSVTGIAKWRGELVYTDHEHIEPLRFEFEDLKATQRSWEDRAGKIYAERKFPKQPSPLCAWCPASHRNGGPCDETA